MLEITCPLSHSRAIDLIETFQVTDLVYLYRKILQIDVTAEFADRTEIGLYQCPESGLQFFHPPIAGSAQFYEQLQPRADYYADEKDEYGYAHQWIQPSDRVLEIGCGKAVFASQIRCADYHGLEFSPKAVEMANRAGWNVTQETVQAHAQIHADTYDVVCAFQVLEHVAELRSFIQASLDCLKPNGILIYSAPSADSFIRRIPNFVLDMPPHHVTRWSDIALKNIIHYHPLECLEIWHEPLQSFHHQLYLETIFRSAWSHHLKHPDQRIDRSTTGRGIHLISRILAKVLAPGLKAEKHLPAGQTVVAVYRKTC